MMARRRWLASPVNRKPQREDGIITWLNEGWAVEYVDWPNPASHRVLMYLKNIAADPEAMARSVAADYNAQEAAKT